MIPCMRASVKTHEFQVDYPSSRSENPGSHCDTRGFEWAQIKHGQGILWKKMKNKRPVAIDVDTAATRVSRLTKLWNVNARRDWQSARGTRYTAMKIACRNDRDYRVLFDMCFKVLGPPCTDSLAVSGHRGTRACLHPTRARALPVPLPSALLAPRSSTGDHEPTLLFCSRVRAHRQSPPPPILIIIRSCTPPPFPEDFIGKRENCCWSTRNVDTERSAPFTACRQINFLLLIRHSLDNPRSDFLI